jgi:hypothetical protein
MTGLAETLGRPEDWTAGWAATAVAWTRAASTGWPVLAFSWAMRDSSEAAEEPTGVVDADRISTGSPQPIFFPTASAIPVL